MPNNQSQSINASKIIPNEQVYINMCVYMCIYAFKTIIEKEAMNLKESGKGHKGGLEGGKGKGEM